MNLMIVGRAIVFANPIILVVFKLPRPVQKSEYVEILRNETSPLVFQCTIESRGRQIPLDLTRRVESTGSLCW